MKTKAMLSDNEKVAYPACAVSSQSIFIIFILLIGTIGCSERSYTGLTAADIDQYIVPGEGDLCLENAFDSVCLEYTQGKKKTHIHIYLEDIVYTFYYEDAVLLQAQAERQNGVPEINGDAEAGHRVGHDANRDAEAGHRAGHDANGGDDANGDNSGVNTDHKLKQNGVSEINGDRKAGHDANGGDDATVNNNGANTDQQLKGWVVWVYYQSGIPADAIPSLEGSGFTITVLDDTGTDITNSVTDVALVRGDTGNALRFFVPVIGQRITVHVQGLVASEHVAIFVVDASGEVDSQEKTYTLQ